MSSSTTADNDNGPPAKKVRIKEPRPEPKLKIGDVALVQLAWEDGTERGPVVIKISEVSWDSELELWFCGGTAFGTRAFIKAPECETRKALYEPGQEVDFQIDEGEYDGKIKLIWIDSDDDDQIVYKITANINVFEKDITGITEI